MGNSKHISLSITERCNLNCIYCFEKSKSQTKMDYNTAVSVLDYEISNSNEYSSIIVDFMGGEPFLEFALIKKICEHYWSSIPTKPIRFITTTNGTLVNGSIKRWLAANSDRFVCALSLDGIRAAHNINRCLSFDRIDIDFFLKTWPKQKVKSIVSKHTLPLLSQSVMYMHELGFPEIEIKLAYGFDWSDDETCHIFLSELQKLREYYNEHLFINPCTFMNINILETAKPVSYIKKWCHAGERTISYDMKGNRFPCRYFQDLKKSGKITLEQIWEYDYTSIQNELTDGCQCCLLRNVCRTCYAYNFDNYLSFGKKPRTSCRVTQIMAYKTAQLTLDRLSLNTIDHGEDSLIQACQKIINAFENNNFYIG